MHEDEIKGVIERLENANTLIKEQESRIRFLKNSGEDVTSLEAVLKTQIERRDRVMRAIEIEVKISESDKGTSHNTEPAKD